MSGSRGGHLIRRVPPEVFRGYGPLVRQRIYTHSFPLVRWLFWRRLGALLSILPDHDCVWVLDCGCGEGAFLPTLSSHFPEVCAVDHDVRGACRLASDMSLLNVHITPGDIYALPYRGGTFDLVVTADVLEHLRDLPRALSEIHRVLRPGGVLLASIPTENTLYELGRCLFGFRKPHDHYHEPPVILNSLAQRFRIIRLLRFPWNLADSLAAFILVGAEASSAKGG